MSREPLVSLASVTAFVSAVITVVVAFGVELSQEQTAGILGLVAVLAPAVVAIFTRSRVTPVTKTAGH